MPNKNIKKSEEREEVIDNKNDTYQDSNDVVFEAEEQDNSDIIKKLKDKNKEISSEKQEYLEGWQRAKADLINARRNFEEERKKILKFAITDLVAQLFPVLDSFEIVSNDKRVDEEPFLREWVIGVRQIYSQFLSILKENGVEEIVSLNEKFNPIFHEPLEIIKVDNSEKDGIIIEVIQKGYLLNGTVIRPAKVKVGEYKVVEKNV